MSNILAALGRAQLTRLDAMIETRRKWRDRYREFFLNIPGIEIFGGNDIEDNCWLTSVIVDPAIARVSSEEMQAELQKAGVESRPLWKPMHLQPVFRTHPALITGASQQQFERGLTLPSGSELSDHQIDRIFSVLSQVFAG